MGMTIDKAQSNLRNIQRYYIKADNETIDFAIDILRKYQKIEEIISDYEGYKWDEIEVSDIRRILDGKID